MGILRDLYDDHVRPEPIGDESRFNLNFVQRLVRYRHLPIKVILNLVMLALLVFYLEAYQLSLNEYIINARFGLAAVLIRPGADDRSFSKDLTTIDDLTNFISDTVTSYYDAPYLSSGQFMHFAVATGDDGSRGTSTITYAPPCPVLSLTYFMDRYDEITRKETSYTVTSDFDLTNEDPLGPLNEIETLIGVPIDDCEPKATTAGTHIVPCSNSSIDTFVDRLESASLKVTLRGVFALPLSPVMSVVMWKMRTDFRFADHNTKLVASSKFDFVSSQALTKGPIIITAVLIPIALLDIINRLYFFVRHQGFLARYSPSSTATDGTTLVLVHNYYTARNWTFLGLIGDGVTLLFALMTLSTDLVGRLTNSTLLWRTTLLGLALFVQCAQMTSHFQNMPRVYLLVDALVMAIPRLALYVVAVFPILLGFSICASSVLGGLTPEFATLSNSLLSFFCMAHGDSLIDVVNSATQSDWWLLKWFTVSLFAVFMLLFYLNVYNVALAIVQDSYSYVARVHHIQASVQQIDGFLPSRKGSSSSSGGTDTDLQRTSALAQRSSYTALGEQSLTREEVHRLLQRLDAVTTIASSFSDSDSD